MSLTVDSANNISGYLTSQFGLAIARADRKVVYSSMDVTWNQVDFFEVAGGSYTLRYYDALVGRSVLAAQIMIDPPPLNRRAVAHTISISGSQVVVSGGTERTFILLLMR